MPRRRKNGGTQCPRAHPCRSLPNDHRLNTNQTPAVPSPWDVFSVGFRESGFQTGVARASRPCVGCTIHTGGTPVPLPWKRHGRRNFVCSTCRVCEWLNTYGTSRPRRRPRPCSLAFLNTPSRRGQGVFENGSRRRKEADFGAKNISAFATRLRLAPKPEAKAEKRHSRRAVAPSQRVGGTAVRLVTF